MSLYLDHNASTPVRPEVAEAMQHALRDLGARVQTGVFGADMKVSLVNDGPVTIVLDAGEWPP